MEEIRPDPKKTDYLEYQEIYCNFNFPSKSQKIELENLEKKTENLRKKVKDKGFFLDKNKTRDDNNTVFKRLKNLFSSAEEKEIPEKLDAIGKKNNLKENKIDLNVFLFKYKGTLSTLSKELSRNKREIELEKSSVEIVRNFCETKKIELDLKEAEIEMKRRRYIEVYGEEIGLRVTGPACCKIF